MHSENAFVTLTYDNDCLPVDGSLDKRTLQLFFKRLRKKLKKRVRYYACGEYGEEGGRPHYHALIFGHCFSDRKLLKRTGSGFNIYMSKELQSCWEFGYTSVGDVTFESAAYVARYVMKKITGGEKDEHYVDKRTGVVRQEEFTLMSRRPGIGFSWFDKYKTDVYPRGLKVVRGVEVKPPRYYDTKYEESDPEAFRALKAKRYLLTNLEENSMSRLLVKEEVTLQKISRLKRELEYV